MGDQGANDLVQALAAIQTQLQALGERMTRIEQPPPPARRVRARNINPQRIILEDGDESDSEEEPPDPEPGQRRQQHRDREEEVDARNRNNDIKLTAPIFAGKVNPDAYLDWERRMEYIFEHYNYSDQRKVSLAAAQLSENALAWWDRDVSERRRHRHGQITTWADMRFAMRKRYVPAYYYRELQKKFRKLTQGSRSVEEYFDEFETLRNRLESEDSDETLMAQFIDGLHDRIARKVEKQTYHDLNELLYLATQAEQHIKRKTLSTSRSKPVWNQQPQKILDKGKTNEADSRFKKSAPEPSKFNKPEQGNTQTQ
ncbi:hypothetical protein V5N11_009056 [Cardamine amara subsp. amara]|uniref:Retrotransposon gag domain-containing protein n=1 Tax=Cardamine amara subsp. amara TaxID=228776 RepID=A0ABD1C7L1_CARAN